MTPRKAKTFYAACKLKHDNVISGDSWIIYDNGGVVITNKKIGENPRQISLTKKQFNRFIKWWETGK